MKIKDFTDIKLYNICNTQKDSPTIGDYFELVIERITKQSRDGLIGLSQNIFIISTLIEKIIKDTLVTVNASLVLKNVDLEKILILSGKSKRFVKSVQTQDIECASISELTKRFFNLKQGIQNCEQGLHSFFKIRNKFVHPLVQTEIDVVKANLHLVKDAIPFLKNYIRVDDELWGYFNKIKEVVHDQYKESLVKYIIAFRRKSKSFSLIEIKQLLAKSMKLDQNEILETKNMVCPACFNGGVDFISGVEWEWEHGETTPYAYQIIKCRVCGIEFDISQFKELVENHELYFKDTLDISDWNELYDHHFNRNYYDDI